MRVDREQDAHGLPRPLDVPVERLVEAIAVLHRHERVEEDDRVRPVVVHAADLLIPAVGAAVGRRPARVTAGPVPQSGSELPHLHAVSILAGPGTTRKEMHCFAFARSSCSRARRRGARGHGLCRRRRPTKLTGTVGPGFTITLKRFNKPLVRLLRPGRYSITVSDKSNIHNFHLTGPGGVNKEITTIGFVGTKTVTVKP